MGDEEVLTPVRGLARRAEHPGPQLAVGDVAPRVLVLLAENLVPLAVERTRARPLPCRAAQAPLWEGRLGGEPVTLALPGVGAPATALAAEKLVAAGGRVLVGVGYAGGLDPALPSASLVAVAAALREEGTSAHYGFSGPDVPADARLAAALGAAADRAGRIVTTDAPYRETRAKVARWRSEGALAVEMETAGLLAVASFRGARAAAAVVVTDRLLEEGWIGAPPGTVDGGTRRAIDGALAALAAQGADAR